MIRESREAQEVSKCGSSEPKSPLKGGPLDVEVLKPEHWNSYPLAWLQLGAAPLPLGSGCPETQGQLLLLLSRQPCWGLSRVCKGREIQLWESQFTKRSCSCYVLKCTFILKSLCFPDYALNNLVWNHTSLWYWPMECKPPVWKVPWNRLHKFPCWTFCV